MSHQIPGKPSGGSSRRRASGDGAPYLSAASPWPWGRRIPLAEERGKIAGETIERARPGRRAGKQREKGRPARPEVVVDSPPVEHLGQSRVALRERPDDRRRARRPGPKLATPGGTVRGSADPRPAISRHRAREESQPPYADRAPAQTRAGRQGRGGRRDRSGSRRGTSRRWTG